MPELPEVESYARYFARHALEQRIARVDVRDERILGGIRKARFIERLKGRSFRGVRRHGKHLFADAGSEWLHLHFGMTGDLAYYGDAAEEPRFVRIVFDFDGGAHLAFEDMRLFGVADLTPSPDVFIAEHDLGPDPLDPSFTLRDFRGIVRGRRGAIKSLLMSQEIIAGLGNLYVDETLFQTSIHPRRAADTLSDAEAKVVFAAMRRILRSARRTMPREESERCPRCGGSIGRTVVFGRTTYFCPRHQR